MDESGDLGFDFSKPKTSKYFVVTFLFANDKKPIEKLVKKIFAGFSKTEVKNHHGTLHAYKERPVTRLRLLKMLAEQKVHVLTIRLNKQNVYTKLKDEKHVLYNYVVNILLDRMIRKKLVPTKEKICFIASKRETNKFLNENFSQYLRQQTKQNHKLDIEIHIKTPSQEKGLQAVDCLAWSFFRKYEHEDESYAEVVKAKVVEENGLFV
jgi:arsenate reductase-like glutaredoxin family protein